MRSLIVLSALLMSAAAASTALAEGSDRYTRYMADVQPWHGRHYYTEWGTPVALVVPPTVQNQVNWGWGVGTTRVSPIYHQFKRPYPGPYSSGAGFMPTPRWPSDTTQFGVHYVRGPW